MDVMIDFNNKCEREEIHELLKEAIKEAGEKIKVECPTGTLKALEKLIETQEKIIEDHEERIAIVSPDVIYCKDCKMSTPPCDGWGRRCEYVGVVTDDHYCGWGKLKGGEA